MRRFPVVLALALGPYGAAAVPALATDAGVRGTVRVQNARTKLSPQIRQVLATSKVDNPAIPGLIRTAEAIETRLGQAATAVAHTAAESSKVQQGRHDWLTGVRQLKNGLAEFVTALRDVETGLATKARADFRTAVEAINAGQSLSQHADRELGLPIPG